MGEEIDLTRAYYQRVDTKLMYALAAAMSQETKSRETKPADDAPASSK